MVDAPPGAPVVVGVDGSAASLTAVGLAVRMAVARNRPVRLVYALVRPLMHLPLGPSPYGPEDGSRHDAERVIAQGEAYAQGFDPRARVSTDIVAGGASGVLIAESRHAAMVVVGDRGLGGFTGLLLGSVAVQVAAHAACPVVVARGTERTAGPVVVGVDGSPTSAQAIAFAAREAVLRQSTLIAVHAWSVPVSTGPGDMLPLLYDADKLQAEETRVLSESVAGLTDTHPDLRVEQRVVEGQAAGALIELSRQAQLVVVGSRGHGGFAGLLLGSVSQALTHHADSPVAVIRPTNAD